jgi:hypothetical protein
MRRRASAGPGGGGGTVETDRFPRPAEAVRFLEKKINVPTEKWDDLKWGEHAHALTAAHSVEADILDDIHGLLNKAIASGESYDTWRKGMLGAMEKAGWYGGNGHTKDDTKYINWRLRIIYDTNMGTAYSAAQYRKQLQDAPGRPIWVYKSKVYGDNRRQEHLDLHNKAFRWDDPFWDAYYPPNGWGCQCYVAAKSESGAEREKIAVEDSSGIQLPDIDPAWRYNPGREALAPNFRSYKNLAGYRMDDKRSALAHAADRYRQDMDGTRMTGGEFNTLIKRMDQKDYTPQGVMYQVGNLDRRRHEAVMKAGVDDSRIMAADRDLYHSAGDKNAAQKIPAGRLADVYQILQTPERIFENTAPKSRRFGREFHFVKNAGGKVIKVVLRQRLPGTSLRIATMGYVEDQYGNPAFKKIW